MGTKFQFQFFHSKTFVREKVVLLLEVVMDRCWCDYHHIVGVVSALVSELLVSSWLFSC